MSEAVMYMFCILGIAEWKKLKKFDASKFYFAWNVFNLEGEMI